MCLDSSLQLPYDGYASPLCRLFCFFPADSVGVLSIVDVANVSDAF